MTSNQQTNGHGTERVQQSERRDRMGTNVYSAMDNQSLHKSLNGEFLLYQILLQRILDDKKQLSAQKSTIYEYFKPENPNDQLTMKEFDQEYQSEKAIHWYTRETCIYKILNKALRTQNIDDVLPFEHFIRDLNKQLQQEYKSFVKQQKTSIITLYRGQLISIDEVNRLKTAKGQLISINSFLSTSSNKKKALEFATSRPPPNDQLTSILLEIDVNILDQTRPLADIRYLSAFPQEEEILFMFGSIFRIDNFWFDDKIKLWRAKLTLCEENDSDIKDFSSTVTGELDGKNRLISLGNYFVDMQKYEEAEEFYRKLLEYNILNDPFELADCYHGLAQVNDKKAEYKSAIENLQTALNYLLKNCPTNDHPLISQCYNDLGSIYTKEGNFLLAMQYYEKAIQTNNNILSNTYSGLSQIQFQMGNYNLALEYSQNALQKQPTTAHSFIANNYIDMGKIYSAMNQKEKATTMFDKAIETQLKVLSPKHPDLGYTYSALGLMYSDMNEEKKAFEFIEKAYQLQLEYLPNNHFDFAQTYTNFGDLYRKKGDLDQALSYYHKTLENQLKTLLWSHSSVAKTYLNIGNIYWKKKDYEQALIYFHKILDSELKRKIFGDPSLSKTFKNLGDLYLEKEDFDQALIFYHKILDNELETKLDEDISLVDVYRTTANIYYKKRLLSKSLLYYNRLLDCYLRKQPLDENAVAEIYALIGKVYLKKRQFNDSLLYYEKLINNSSNDKTSGEKVSNGKITFEKTSNKKIKDQKLSNGKSSDDSLSNGTTSEKLLNGKFSKSEYRNIDNIYFEQRHLNQALNYFEKYLKHQLNNSPERDPSIGDIYQILGNIALEKHNLDQALNYFLKLLDNKLTRKTIDDPSLSNIYKSIGRIYFDKNIFDESLTYLNHLVDCRFKKRKSFEDPSVIEAFNLIGEIYLKKDHFDKLSNYLNKLIENKSINNRIKISETNFEFEKYHLEETLFYFENILKNQSFKYFTYEQILNIIGKIYLDKQEFNQSLIYFQQLFNYQIQINPLQYYSLGKTSEIIAIIYQKQSNVNQALQYYRQSLHFYQKVYPINQHLIKNIKHKIHQIILPIP